MNVQVSSGLVASLPRLPAGQVVIFDNFNNPILVAIDLGDNKILVETAAKNNVRFAELLRKMGIGVSKVEEVKLQDGDLVMG